MTRALNTSIDLYNLYVGNQDITAAVLNATATNSLSISATATNSLINVTATTSSTYTSPTQYCSQHNGVALYVSFASISVNAATLALNIGAIDPLTGATFPWIRASLDNVIATATHTVVIFPGISATLAATNSVQINNTLPPSWTIKASLTATTSAGMSGTLSYKIGGSKLW